VTPNNSSSYTAAKTKAEPQVKEPIIKEAAETPVAAAAAAAPIATQPQQFPTTKEFDTSLGEPQETGHNWSSSFYGLSTERFPGQVADILLEPINPDDVEIKPGNT
jgi:hypothetical protein